MQVRVYRIQRDIPMPLVTSGVEKGNLRELALARMGQLGLRCRDVRTREAGIQDIHNNVRPTLPSRRLHCLFCAVMGAAIWLQSARWLDVGCIVAWQGVRLAGLVARSCEAVVG